MKVSEMEQIKQTQEEFFLALSGIQEWIVLEYLKNSNIDSDMEKVLYDITTETICQVMSLLDGYGKKSVQLDIIDKISGESLRKGIELHDKCMDYLR